MLWTIQTTRIPFTETILPRLFHAQSDWLKTDGLNSKNLTVGRASMGFLDESFVGVIFTNGNPLRNVENRLGGADLTLKSSNFLGSSQVVEMNAYVMRSDGEGQVGNAFGGRLLYPNFTWDAGLTFGQLGTNFNPALGFIEQAGTRNYSGWLGRAWRPEGLDSVRVGLFAEDKTTLDGRPITGSLWLPDMTVTSTSQDSLYIAPVVRREQYFVPFELAPGVIIPSGEYSWLAYHLFLESAKTRAVVGLIDFECCAYLNRGHRMNLDTRLVWRPSAWFNLTAIYNQVRLDAGWEIHRAHRTTQSQHDLYPKPELESGGAIRQRVERIRREQSTPVGCSTRQRRVSCVQSQRRYRTWLALQSFRTECETGLDVSVLEAGAGCPRWLGAHRTKRSPGPIVTGAVTSCDRGGDIAAASFSDDNDCDSLGALPHARPLR